jgi:hypothetical protein
MGLGEENRLRLSFPDSQDSIKKVTALSMTANDKKEAHGKNAEKACLRWMCVFLTDL